MHNAMIMPLDVASNLFNDKGVKFLLSALLFLGSAVASASIVDYGPPQDALGHWEFDLYDASGNERGTTTYPLYFKAAQLPTALGGQTLANSTSFGLATDQFSLLSTAALQSAGNTSSATIATTVGSVAGTIATASQLSAGQYLATAPTLTTGQQGALQLDTNGRLVTNSVPVDGTKASYSATIVSGVPVTVTPTDVMTITGSATKTIRITRIGISGVQATAGQRDAALIKRSTADTGGTSTTVVAVPHDSANAAATATVLFYTANPTVGTSVGTIRAQKLFFATSVLDSDNYEWNFGTRPAQAIVLRGTTQQLAINLTSLAGIGNIVDISIEWSEE